jgi:cytochrome P450
MAEFEPRVRALAIEMLITLIEAGDGDFVADFSYAFPTRVLCMLLGVPDDDWKLINEWAAATDRAVGRQAPGSHAHIAAGEELRPYMLSLVEQRRVSPGDDIVSGIIHGDPELPSLADEAIVGVVMMLLSAGHNTTTNAIGNLVLRVARDPDLQGRLRSEPHLIPLAIEESLRIESPQQAMRRTATKDVELAGQPIKQGELVWLVFGAANLDSSAIEDPTTFRLDRGTNRHQAFGRGIHLCLGAPLARLEVRVVLEELLARTESIEVAGTVNRTEWPRMGVTSLPLRTIRFRGRTT